MPDDARDPRLAPLDALVGRWRVEPRFDRYPHLQDVHGEVTFEWVLGGAFLLERSQVDHPDAPDVHAVIGPGEDGDGLVQHYFDSRGVVRRYAMTFDGTTWTLEREHPGFSQRYAGRLSDDGTRIEGTFELRRNGDWELDFHMDYVRMP